MQKLTTRGPRVAEAIAARQDFTTHGALSGRAVSNGLSSPGLLAGNDLDRFHNDADRIDYVVTSYATPIAWHTPTGWYKVAQRFSATTSKHQGQLYRVQA